MIGETIKIVIDDGVYDLSPTEINGNVFWRTEISDDLKYVSLHWDKNAGEYIVLILSKSRRICYIYGSGSQEYTGRYVYHKSTGISDEERPSLVAILE